MKKRPGIPKGTKRGSAVCQVCGARVPLRLDGRLRYHVACAGSYQVPTTQS